MDLLTHIMKLISVDQAVSRISPTGAREFAAAESESEKMLKQGTKALTNLNTGESVYHRDWYNDPKTQMHEGIHQGQAALERNLPAEPIIDIFRKLSSRFNVLNKQAGNKSPEIEQPAYNLSELREPLHYRMTEEYLNHLKRNNAGDAGILDIEASIPEEALRRYIKESAPPIRMPIPKELKGKR